MALITTLIDEQDNKEIVRDAIAAILVSEVAGQQLLATAASEDPRLWDLRVFVERTNPWSEFKDNPEQLDTPPIVSVSFDSSTIDKSASNTVSRQRAIVTYNLDCYGYGKSSASGVGHVAGDHQAALASMRAVRLVRQILMAGHYITLGMDGVVGGRMIQSIAAFQPQFENRAVQNVLATRIAFEVQMNEFSPQVQAVDTLGLVVATVKRAETGEVYLVAQYGDDS